MRHRKALVASLVISTGIIAGGSSSALAMPEWFQKGAVIANNLNLGGISVFPELTNTKFELACNQSGISGEIAKPNKVIKTTITFAGCNGKKPGEGPCKVKSKGAAGVEEIKTEELAGVLGEVAAAEATSERGLELKPVNAGNVFTVLEGACLPASPEKVTGNIIGEISPKKKEEKSFNLNFVLKAGKQEIREFKGAGGNNFLTSFGEEFALEDKNLITFSIVEAGCTVVKKVEIT